MKLTTLVASALSLACIAGASQAATIVNGSFEAPSDWSGPFRTYGTGSTALTGWKVEGSGVDHINTLWQHSDGDFSLDLSASNAGAITQKVTGLAVGTNYRLMFDMAGNSARGNTVKSLEARMGGVIGTFYFDTTGKSVSDMGWVTYSFDFTAAATESVLKFQSLDNNGYGPALDNVRLVETPSQVPLPASGLLLMGAVAVIAGARRRRA